MSSITLHHLNLSRYQQALLGTRRAQPPLRRQSSLPHSFTIGPRLVEGALTESSFIIQKLLSLPEVREASKKGELAVQVPQSDGDVFWSHFTEGSQLDIFTGIA
ncbi:hypothetical protein L198_07495 [Cryptococcus wingfieldii CBS 7118]|uniref:Uncharacterized protein n=1 Tax=Cryptococcus wingfieldii CBS 7118 TaxID=1295528 RepID=A0A1E3ICM8_9TREE|nr:hypothetical protein L198_07495 [Cryptococcus wingfieldii CBS 7118]ODN85666.1 hypothetical protein L198_07495 [Cryptococcus wingfieldii CBS 7118]